MPPPPHSRKRLRCGGFCFGSIADGREGKPLPYDGVYLNRLFVRRFFIRFVCRYSTLICQLR